jgi:hypothetical protein
MLWRDTAVEDDLVSGPNDTFGVFTRRNCFGSRIALLRLAAVMGEAKEWPECLGRD